MKTSKSFAVIPAAGRSRRMGPTHKLLLQYDPGEQIDVARVGGKEGHHFCATKDSQRGHVKVIGQNPKQAEEAGSGHKLSCEKIKLRI